jgi:hypothetical protein
MGSSANVKYKWLDRIKSDHGPPDAKDRWLLVCLGGWMRTDGAWSDKLPTYAVLARQTGFSLPTVKERMGRLNGVWFQRQKEGRQYRYRPRFPRPDEVQTMPSLGTIRERKRATSSYPYQKGYQSVAVSETDRATEAPDRDTSSHPINGYQPVSPIPIPKDRPSTPTRSPSMGRARAALPERAADGRCLECGTFATCRPCQTQLREDASRGEPEADTEAAPEPPDQPPASDTHTTCPSCGGGMRAGPDRCETCTAVAAGMAA